MSGKRFVNLGVPGQGTTADLERLKQSGFLEAHPKVILLQVSQNDVPEDLVLEENVPLHGMDLQRKGSAARSSPWDELTSLLTKKSALYFAAAEIISAYESRGEEMKGGGKKENQEIGVEIQRANLDQFYELARRHRSKLGIIEDSRDIRRDFRWPPPATMGVAEIDAGVPGEERVKFDGHWNRAGQLRAARTVFDRLSELGWLRL